MTPSAPPCHTPTTDESPCLRSDRPIPPTSACETSVGYAHTPPQDPPSASGYPRQRLTTRALEHVVGRTARRAGIVAKRISPHSLRHTFAIRALRNGSDVTAVSKLLGHANVATTMRYVDHLETAALRGALPMLPGSPAR